MQKSILRAFFEFIFGSTNHNSIKIYNTITRIVLKLTEITKNNYKTKLKKHSKKNDSLF